MIVTQRDVIYLIVGIATLLLAVCEIGVGIWLNSLVLLSDGFHNFNDVIAVAIALWAYKAADKGASDRYSYGWVRTEIIAALINSVSLLSLCLYIALETIPRFVSPEPIDAPGVTFIVVAAVGLAVNIGAVIIFAITGHGHSHVGHDHGEHNGGHEQREGHGGEHTHEHEHEEGGEHEEHAHSHEHEEGGEHGEHGHSHEHGEHREHGEHDNEGRVDVIKSAVIDHNLKALMLHFLGDTLSSVFVLATALLVYFFPGQRWVLYIDPAFTWVIIGIILWTTIPLIITVSKIMLQSTAKTQDVATIKLELCSINGVLSVHDLHIWELIPGLTIATLHVDCAVFTNGLAVEIKRVFHRHNIHSVTIQPEFVTDADADTRSVACEQMCIEECEERWCCQNEK